MCVYDFVGKHGVMILVTAHCSAQRVTEEQEAYHVEESGLSLDKRGFKTPVLLDLWTQLLVLFLEKFLWIGNSVIH